MALRATSTGLVAASTGLAGGGPSGACIILDLRTGVCRVCTQRRFERVTDALRQLQLLHLEAARFVRPDNRLQLVSVAVLDRELSVEPIEVVVDEDVVCADQRSQLRLDAADVRGLDRS